ncbi:hypothetical protein [Actinoplanes siamensis]|uniref:Uncharacterized protein n=1 Tax=Actinoplanes siamensis TaxID=1223317 RepID=A0A919TNQ0_9ACTN|nr:hypothetical protein [Actinoplanes siamensis]GIF09009.1 hypothetical protein Asi03nite_65470 [Actinoplanes siamensis]
MIFLTHNRDPHEVNLGWHRKAEELIRRPDLQQPERSQNGSWKVRYRTGAEGRRYVATLLDPIAARTPYRRVRYAF